MAKPPKLKAYQKSYIKKIEIKRNSKCGACNGSGYYDTTNSPKCSACNGTGRG